jgi:hypothetical protein
MDRSLASLDGRFQPLVYELLAKITEAEIPVMIINTLRTTQEQSDALTSGHSWVLHSKHQDGLAIDICPFDTYMLHGPDKLKWDTNDPVWEILGKIGESLGLRWGGRFAQKDMGHFEYVKPSDTSIHA